VRPKVILRNKVQSLLDLTIMGPKAFMKGNRMYHTEKGRQILGISKKFKSRSFIIGQEWSAVKRIFKLGGAGYRWSDKSNVGQSILTAYNRYVDSYGHEETVTIPGTDIKYSPKALKLAEDHFKDTQWAYCRELMPKVFWSTTGRFAFGLTSWPMSYFNRYVPEVARRTFRGVDGRGNKVQGTERLAGLRWLLLIGFMAALYYGSRKVFKGKKALDYRQAVLPSPRYLQYEGWGPSMQFVYGLWMAVTASSERMKAHGWYLVKRSAQVHAPFGIAIRDINKLASGEDDIIDYLFYTDNPEDIKKAEEGYGEGAKEREIDFGSKPKRRTRPKRSKSRRLNW